MSAGGDAEMAELAAAELPDAQAKVSQMLEALKDEFVAAEDKAVDSFFLEIRAGTGGDEAALFAGDLFEMYRKYSEQHRWRFDVSDFSTSERGGFKEVVVNIKGNGRLPPSSFRGRRAPRASASPKPKPPGGSTPASPPSPSCRNCRM